MSNWTEEIAAREVEAELAREPGKLLVVDLSGIPAEAIREARRTEDHRKAEEMERALIAAREAARAESLADMLANKGRWDAADKQRARAAELRRIAKGARQ